MGNLDKHPSSCDPQKSGCHLRERGAGRRRCCLPGATWHTFCLACVRLQANPGSGGALSQRLAWSSPSRSSVVLCLNGIGGKKNKRRGKEKKGAKKCARVRQNKFKRRGRDEETKKTGNTRTLLTKRPLLLLLLRLDKGSWQVGTRFVKEGSSKKKNDTALQSYGGWEKMVKMTHNLTTMACFTRRTTKQPSSRATKQQAVGVQCPPVAFFLSFLPFLFNNTSRSSSLQFGKS